jgi:hypothetical protein
MLRQPKSVSLTDFIGGGTSRYVCTNTRGKCEQMASPDGRECVKDGFCDCKRKRYSSDLDEQFFLMRKIL